MSIVVIRQVEQERSGVARRLVPALAALAVALAGCAAVGPRSLPPGEAVVERVVDGDTVVLDLGASEETARLIGVDTPETNHPTVGAECYGREASAHLERLLPGGTRVRVERDVEARDRYGRLLVYVHRADDGLFVNEAMVAEGFAAALTVPPNVAYADRFAALAADARRAGVGLWSACGGPDAPA